ncbi:MAG: hypothetical protein F4Y02_01965 [Chloroflexi bacterium]|nr:hypothetical protein [Chloroflexota bacterium]
MSQDNVLVEVRTELREFRLSAERRLDRLHDDLEKQRQRDSAQDEGIAGRVPWAEYNKCREQYDRRVRSLEQVTTEQGASLRSYRTLLMSLVGLLIPFVGWVLSHLHWV